jgi:hypothetical protein
MVRPATLIDQFTQAFSVYGLPRVITSTSLWSCREAPTLERVGLIATDKADFD